jgi:hypothetical protein
MANSRKKRRRASAPATDAQNIGASTAGAGPDSVRAEVLSFSRTVAKDDGEKAAVLLQFLAHHVSKSEHVHAAYNFSASILKYFT